MKKRAERAKQVTKLLRSLYKSLYSDDKDRNPQRVQGTCEWFTSHDRFRDWRDGETCGLLWVSADPGCGKSVLSRYLVDDVLPSSSSSTTCYFFFKDDLEDQKSAAGALCCLLRQIFKKKPALLKDPILKQYDEDGDMLLDSFHELWHILVSVSTHHGSGRIICILDALDECEEQDRRLLVETLNDFYLDNGTNTTLKFLVTSRPYVSIELGFHDVQTKLPTIHLRGEGQSESDKIAREIDLVVEARIAQLCEKLKLRRSEETVMRQELKKRPNRTYLWVYLVFEMLESCAGHSFTQIEEHIRNLPATVDDAYEKILSRSSDKKKARKLLHMVVAAKRPLKLKEMAVALTIERHHTLCSQLKIEPEERLCTWVRELCGLFVSIVNDRIYLLHQTAAEFLVERVEDGESHANPLKEGNARSEWKCSLSLGSSNLILGSVCAQLLLFTDVVDDIGKHLDANLQITSESLGLLDKDYPLLTYSVEHWVTHLGDASGDIGLPLMNMLQLCSGSKSACLFLLPGRDGWLSRPYQHAKALTPLVVASILGLAAVTRHLLTLESTDANERDPVFKLPPLSWAVRIGHKAVLDTFIEAEERYQRRRHRLKRLLGRCYVDFDVRNEEAPVDPHIHNGELKGPTTPLEWAVVWGEEQIVEKLLKTGCVTVAKEMLFEAAMNDREDMLRALLGAGQVGVQCKAKNGRRLLNWALKHSAVRVTKYLLDTDMFDVGAEMQPWEGELSGVAYAAKHGAVELLQLLLATGKAEIDFQNDDSDGKTPLSLAAEAGAEECARLLLATGNVEVNNMDDRGQTPLSLAAQGGHDRIVHQLLVTGKAIIDAKDSNEQTPLFHAAERGFEWIALQLLAMKADINAKDENGRTPFLAAVVCNGGRLFDELLATSDADVNTKDRHGYTPLMLAVLWGSEGVVRRLLATGKVDVNARDGEGNTPLRFAILSRRLNIVEALLETRDVIITPNCWDLVDWLHSEGYVRVAARLTSLLRR